jgi:hypothetical protein
MPVSLHLCHALGKAVQAVRSQRLPAGVLPVAHGYNVDNALMVIDGVDHTVVAYAQPP